MRFRSINVARARELLEYCPSMGGSCLTWKVSPRYGINIGDMAGWMGTNGYWRVRIDNVTYLAHRLVWAVAKGEDPVYQLDHIKGHEAGNHIENLRLAPRGQLDNNQNRRRNKNNKSGYPGVNWYDRYGKWVVRILAENKRIFLGYFDDPKEAYEAYCKAKAELHTFSPEVRHVQ